MTKVMEFPNERTNRLEDAWNHLHLLDANQRASNSIIYDNDSDQYLPAYHEIHNDTFQWTPWTPQTFDAISLPSYDAAVRGETSIQISEVPVSVPVESDVDCCSRMKKVQWAVVGILPMMLLVVIVVLLVVLLT